MLSETLSVSYWHLGLCDEIFSDLREQVQNSTRPKSATEWFPVMSQNQRGSWSPSNHQHLPNPLRLCVYYTTPIISRCGVLSEFWRGISSLRAQVQLPIMYSESVLALVLDQGSYLFFFSFLSLSLFLTKCADCAQSGGRSKGVYRQRAQRMVARTGVLFRSLGFLLSVWLFDPKCSRLQDSFPLPWYAVRASLAGCSSKVVLFTIQSHVMGVFFSDSTPNDLISPDCAE